MPSLPNDISRSDLNQWVGSGWFYAVIDGERHPAYLEHVSDDMECMVRTVDDDRAYIPPSSIYTHWAMCGALNVHSSFAAFVERVQQRQWRRTFNSNSLVVSVPQHWNVLGVLSSRTVKSATNTGGHSLVREAFNPTYPSYEEAIEQLRSPEVVSRAINRHVILCGGTGGGRIQLYYRGAWGGILDNHRLTRSTLSDKTLTRLCKQLRGSITV